MSFSDIFKSNFLDNLTSVTILDMVIAMALAFGIGVFIFFVYKKTYKGVMYSDNFGVSLIAMSMITAFMILAVTSNVVLSLGMVGALSIVRFRTAIKDPMDIVYLFWSIGAGIVLAAGLIPLAVFGSAVIGVVLLVFANRKGFTRPYIAVVSCSDHAAEKAAENILSENSKKCCLKSKTVQPGRVELTYEIRLESEDTSFINALSDTAGVSSAILVTYNGEYN